MRGYIAVGLSTNDTVRRAGNTFSANRAFIQWAGFTFGLAQSFYDFYSVPAIRTGARSRRPTLATGLDGSRLHGAVRQRSSATIAAEMRRHGNWPPYFQRCAEYRESPPLWWLPGPDIVGNLRVDQAWGSAQIMGAAASGQCRFTTRTPETSGHPDDKWGFAVGAGIKLNAPMIGQGDYFQAQVNYTQGALRYIFQTPNSNWGYVKATSRIRRAQRRRLWRRAWLRQRIRSRADHRMERQRGLRALLEPALENVAVWRLCCSEL